MQNGSVSHGLFSMALVATLAGGCVVPKTTTSRRTIGTRATGETAGPVGRLVLAAETQGSTIRLRGTRPRMCKRTMVEVVEVTERTSAEVAGFIPDDKDAMPFFLLVAPVTLVTSGILTAIVVAADGDDVHTEEHPSDPEPFACPVKAAGLRVWVELPSGAQVMGRLDAAGELAIPLPAGEPRRGAVTVRTNAARPASLAYHVERSRLSRAEVRRAIEPTADQIRSCARRAEMSGRVVLTIAIADGSASLRATPELDRRFARCADAAFRSLELRAVDEPLRVRFPFELGAVETASL